MHARPRIMTPHTHVANKTPAQLFPALYASEEEERKKKIGSGTIKMHTKVSKARIDSVRGHQNKKHKARII